MSISLTRYVDVTSGLGAGAVVPTRELVGRLFTSNNFVPPGTFLSFSSAVAVGDYFGVDSEEYLRALFYFSFVSKNFESPQSIQYSRWVNVAVAPMIFSAIGTILPYTSWTSISAGTFGLTIGGVVHTFSVDFSAVSSLADVAAAIQTVIRMASGSMFTSATVTYDSLTNSFNFVGGVTGNTSGSGVISVQPGATGTDISGIGYLGWLPQAVNNNGLLSPSTGSIWSNGSDIETLTETLEGSSNVSNNFGSFLFLNNLALTNNQIVEAATWNNAENVLYLYTIPVSSSNASTLAGLLHSIGGCALTLSYLNTTQTGVIASSSAVVTNLNTSLLNVGMPVTGTGIPIGTTIIEINNSTSITLSANATTSASELLTFYYTQYPEQFSMMIEAATNYSAFNSVQNYMFQQVAGLNASVTDDTDANTYDALQVNYYGQTQSAGTVINFYQRGLMQGSGVSSNIYDMTSYINEIWLKDAASAAIMSLLLSENQVPANQQGRSQILSILQGVINQALNNGTISVGKTLTSAQIIYITSASGFDEAWYQVQNNGYWLDCIIIPIPNVTPVQYEANYTLIYSKDDVIRLVNGQQTLI